jgi:hypothetical protein
MATDEGSSRGDEVPKDVYDDYDAFLKRAIREYYDRGWKSRKGNFIALVIASGQMASMAKDSVADGSGLKKAAIGAASVVALRLAWRYFLASLPLARRWRTWAGTRRRSPARSSRIGPWSVRREPASRTSRAVIAPVATTRRAAISW